MKTSESRAFVLQPIVHYVVMILLSGTLGLSTVWLRHQISVKANLASEHERALRETERHIQEAVTDLAAEQSLVALERRNVAWQLGLVQPRDLQIVRMEEDPIERLAARRELESFASETSAGTPTVRFGFADPEPR